jgi:hypothetical protein
MTQLQDLSTTCRFTSAISLFQSRCCGKSSQKSMRRSILNKLQRCLRLSEKSSKSWTRRGNLAQQTCKGTAGFYKWRCQTGARTETAWFRPVWKQADAILFMAKRIAFDRPDGTPHAANSGAPQSLLDGIPWRHLNTLEPSAQNAAGGNPLSCSLTKRRRNSGAFIVDRWSSVSLRMTSAQRRLKWAFYIGTAVFIIVVLTLALR